MMKLTRGERNNNPGNIERNEIAWQGMAPDQSLDSRFVVFVDPVWGIRALARTLLSYEKLYPEGTVKDIDTVEEIIDRWAPPIENLTTSYINAVCTELCVNASARIQIRSRDILTKLVTAIIRHENGRVLYTPLLISNAVTMALAK